MPVPAVIAGGMPTVSSGSQMVIFGIISGWKITFLVCVASSVMTPARPTSEPVPAVVGTATIGRMPSGSARVHQSPTSSKSHIGRVCPAMKAMTLPASSAEPPPNAITPSWPPALEHLQAGLDVGGDRDWASRRENTSAGDAVAGQHAPARA